MLSKSTIIQYPQPPKETVIPLVKLNLKLKSILTQTERSFLEEPFYKGRTEVSLPEFANILVQRDSIGDILMLIRKALNLSIRDFALILNVSHTYISKLENKRSSPTLDTVYIMADKLGIPRLRFIWLFTK